METISWRKPTEEAYILGKNVHIWLIKYDQSNHLLSAAKHILSDEEKRRADRFHFDIDHKRFSMTRTLLKIILGNCLSKPSQDIQFIFNKHGKPMLADSGNEIHFNVSHSGNLGMIAISNISKIGIDVEQFRNEMITENIAKRFFSKLEVEEFLKLAEDEKLQGFFNCWTRKEAFIKAVGLGLSLPLNAFDVTLKPNEPARLVAVRYKNEIATNWTLTDIKLKNGYASAFIIKAKSFSKKFWFAC